MASGFRLWSAVLSAGVALSSRDWAASGATFAVMVAQLPAGCGRAEPRLCPHHQQSPMAEAAASSEELPVALGTHLAQPLWVLSTKTGALAAAVGR